MSRPAAAPARLLLQFRQSSSSASPAPKKISYHVEAGKAIPQKIDRVLQANSTKSISEQIKRAVANTQLSFGPESGRLRSQGGGGRGRKEGEGRAMATRTEGAEARPRQGGEQVKPRGTSISSLLLNRRKEAGTSSFDSDAIAIAAVASSSPAPTSTLRPSSRPFSPSERSPEGPRRSGPSSGARSPRPGARPSFGGPRSPRRDSPSTSSRTSDGGAPPPALSMPKNVAYTPIDLASLRQTPPHLSPRRSSSPESSIESRIASQKAVMGDYSSYLSASNRAAVDGKEGPRSDRVMGLLKGLVERNPSFDLGERDRIYSVVEKTLGTGK